MRVSRLITDASGEARHVLFPLHPAHHTRPPAGHHCGSCVLLYNTTSETERHELTTLDIRDGILGMQRQWWERTSLTQTPAPT